METEQRNGTLVVREVSVVRGDRTVLDRATIECRGGEFIALVGANGVGKSTLLRTIVGSVPGSGVIEQAGVTRRSIGARAWARRVAYLPQQIDLPLGLTAGEFIALGRHPWEGRWWRRSVTADRAVARAVNATAVDPLLERDVSTLSGGERQRVYIAAALAQDTPVLLLDEPTTGLDPVQREEVWRLLDRVRREWGMTILTSTHDIDSAASVVDRFVALRAGRIVFTGVAELFMRAERLAEVYGEAPRERGRDVALRRGA